MMLSHLPLMAAAFCSPTVPSSSPVADPPSSPATTLRPLDGVDAAKSQRFAAATWMVPFVALAAAQQPYTATIAEWRRNCEATR